MPSFISPCWLHDDVDVTAAHPSAAPIASRRIRRLVGWGAIALLTTYCILIGGGWSGIYEVDLRRLSLVLATLGIAGWIVVAIRDPFWRPRTALAPAFVVALAALTLTTITSTAPRLGLEYVAWSVVLVALYLLLARLMAAPFFRERILALTTIAAFTIGLAFLIVSGAAWSRWWGYLGQLAAPPLRPGVEGLTFGNPSAVMTASVLLTTSAIAYLAGTSRARAALALAAVAISIAVTVISGSRSGWLAIAVALGVTTVLWILPAAHRRWIVVQSRTRLVRALGATILAVGLLMAVVAGPGILERASAGGEAYRTAFFAASIRMFESSPLVGIGPGNWAPQRIPFTAAGEVDYYIPYGHDIYLQTAAEQGIVGLAAGIVVLLFLGRLLLGAVRDSDPVRQRVGWCAIFATIYFGAHQLLDFYANAPAILFAFAVPIAWLDATWPGAQAHVVGPGRPAADPRRRWVGGRVVAGTGVFVIVVSVLFLGWAEAGAQSMRLGRTALDDGDVPAAIDAIGSAVSSDPGIPAYHFSLGLALAKADRLASAETEFLASASFDDLPEAWLDLAAVRARLGDVSGSRAALMQAMRMGRQQAGVALGVGATYLELGDEGNAIDAFAQALRLAPSLAGDAWWAADPARAAIWPAVYETASASASPGLRFELALEMGDDQAALAAIRAIPNPGTQTTDRLALAAWTGDESALSDLAARAQANPLDGAPVIWLARIAARRGDTQAETRYRDWLSIIDEGADELRVQDGSRDGIVAGTSALYYGHFDYRRPTPIDQLVPWLPHLVSI
jgi:O-antigen ligase/tetratricopeptide (TPR) repeat protein